MPRKPAQAVETLIESAEDYALDDDAPLSPEQEIEMIRGLMRKVEEGLFGPGLGWRVQTETVWS